MKLFICLCLSLISLHVMASEESVTSLVHESLALSGLQNSLRQSQPNDLRQIENALITAATHDTSVEDEIKNIRYVVITDALQTADSQKRQHKLAVSKYRILLLAGQLGFVPSGR